MKGWSSWACFHIFFLKMQISICWMKSSVMLIDSEAVWCLYYLLFIWFKTVTCHIVNLPLSAGGGGGIEPPTKFSKKGRGWQGFAGKEGGDFFQRLLQFSHKKLKSEIFNDKKSLQAKIFFSVITKNSDWEVLPKNLVTFKVLCYLQSEKIWINFCKELPLALDCGQSKYS